VKYAYLGLREFYGSITEAPEAIFQQNGGGGCRPTRPGELSLPRLGCFLLKQPSFQNALEGARFENFYLQPQLDKFTPHFVFFGLFSFRNLMKIYGFHGDGC